MESVSGHLKATEDVLIQWKTPRSSRRALCGYFDVYNAFLISCPFLGLWPVCSSTSRRILTVYTQFSALGQSIDSLYLNFDSVIIKCHPFYCGHSSSTGQTFCYAILESRIILHQVSVHPETSEFSTTTGIYIKIIHSFCAVFLLQKSNLHWAQLNICCHLSAECRWRRLFSLVLALRRLITASSIV